MLQAGLRDPECCPWCPRRHLQRGTRDAVSLVWSVYGRGWQCSHQLKIQCSVRPGHTEHFPVQSVVHSRVSGICFPSKQELSLSPCACLPFPLQKKELLSPTGSQPPINLQMICDLLPTYSTNIFSDTHVTCWLAFCLPFSPSFHLTKVLIPGLSRIKPLGRDVSRKPIFTLGMVVPLWLLSLQQNRAWCHEEPVAAGSPPISAVHGAAASEIQTLHCVSSGISLTTCHFLSAKLFGWLDRGFLWLLLSLVDACGPADSMLLWSWGSTKAYWWELWAGS